MIIGLGISTAERSDMAAERACRRALQQCPSPDVALMFGSATFDQVALVAAAKKALPPGLPLFGGSTSAEITNAGHVEGSVTVLLLSAPELEFAAMFSPHGADPERAGADVAQQLRARFPGLDPAASPITALVMACELHFAGIKYVEGLRKGLGCNLPLSGGGSLNRADLFPQEQFYYGWQYCNGEAAQASMNLLALRAKQPEAVRFAYAFESSWSPVARPVTCTRADGPYVFELDGMRLDDYYKKIFGPDIFTDPDNLAKYTFIATIETPQGPRQVIRTPGPIDPHDGSSLFYPQVAMQGLTLQLVQISRSELLHGVGSAARRLVGALRDFKPAVVFMFSCHMRKHYLQTMVEQEIAAIRRELGDAVPVVGYYAGGEYSPLFSDYDTAARTEVAFGACTNLSTSISLFAIGTPAATGAAEACNYRVLLEEQLAEDRRDQATPISQVQTVQKLQDRLAIAERDVVTTENTLKLLNTQHFRLAEELEDKNRQLSEAISKNQRLQKLLKQYTPHKVWERAKKSVEQGFFRIPDEEAHYAIMFMDVKGFTSFAENHTPIEVVRELNRIFEHAVNIIHENHGDIDKFIGDCIFAVFDDAAAAFRSARAIQEEMRALAAEGAPFSVRIGINQGRVIRCNVGGSFRRDNTLIGDAVNFAQRLESNCTPGRILLSKDAFAGIGGELEPTDKVEVKQITVKGKKALFEVHEVTV